MEVERVRGRLAGARASEITWSAETGSTNADLLEAAAAGASAGRVMVADHQLAGRGRLDRRWEAPPGSSLLVSVLERPGSDGDSVRPRDAPLLGFALGLAAALAVEQQSNGVVEPMLKWPNDVVVELGPGTRKLGGVLAESLVSQGHLTAVVVGLGLNVAWPDALPDELRDVAVACNHLGFEVERDDLLVAVLQQYDALVATLRRDAQTFLDAYRKRLLTLGRRVRVDTRAGVRTGVARGVGDDGALLVHGDSGVERVTVGDVTHLRDA